MEILCYYVFIIIRIPKLYYLLGKYYCMATHHTSVQEKSEGVRSVQNIPSGNLVRQTVLTVGENRDSPRIWIEGLYLEKAGFEKGCKIKVDWHENSITIVKHEDGDRQVSYKKSPVIDINNSKILQVFKIADKIKVVVRMGKITISRSKIFLRKLTALKDKTFGGCFTGIGLLDEVMKKCGFTSKWGIEVNEKYADMWQKNHNGVMYNSDIAEIDFDELEQVEAIVGGVPCENFSIARQDPNYNPEAETIDMSIFFVNLIERMNPRTIILEEVPQYIKSEIGVATISALKRLGYNVQTRIFSGNQFGMIQNRKRLILIASYDEINFPEEIPFTGTARDILQHPDDPELKWFTKEEKAWIWKHNEKQKAKGNNFIFQEVNEDTVSIQGIPKRYMAILPSQPLVKHPTKELWRLFSMTELKRLFGLDQDYYVVSAKTYAGEGICQGVLVKAFEYFVNALFPRSEN